jgi:hypothetical protein
MANEEHIAKLKEGVEAWNKWRRENADIRPDFRGANFSGADVDAWKLRDANLSGADFSEANLFKVFFPKAKLSEADLTRADLREANLSGADLGEATIRGTEFIDADLSWANPSGTDLTGAKFIRAKLSGANLRGAILVHATLVDTDLPDADLTGCRIYGISAWNVKLDGAKQGNLIFTPEGEPEAMVDDLEVAQFFYLLLKREKIRNVIDTVTRRGVLILGRFEDGGLALLQAVAAWLRKPENGGYLPLLFDFPRPDSKTYTETIRTMVGLARFVIVELSGPSVPQEITASVDLYQIPFVPILEENRKEWSMFQEFLVKERVLEIVRFTDQDHLLELLAKEVIAPAERLVEERQKRLDKIFGRS